MYSILRGCEVRQLPICDNPISSSLSLKVCTCKCGPVFLCRCGWACLDSTCALVFRCAKIRDQVACCFSRFIFHLMPTGSM